MEACGVNKVDAIRTLMVENPSYKDCVDFCCKYISLVRGEEFPYPAHHDHINTKTVSETLGAKPKRKGCYGDVVLYDDGRHSGVGVDIGINRIATISEEYVDGNGNPVPVIIPMPKRRVLYWGIS